MDKDKNKGTLMIEFRIQVWDDTSTEVVIIYHPESLFFVEHAVKESSDVLYRSTLKHHLSQAIYTAKKRVYAIKGPYAKTITESLFFLNIEYLVRKKGGQQGYGHLYQRENTCYGILPHYGKSLDFVTSQVGFKPIFYSESFAHFVGSRWIVERVLDTQLIGIRGREDIIGDARARANNVNKILSDIKKRFISDKTKKELVANVALIQNLLVELENIR